MGVYRTESNNGHVKIAWCDAGDGGQMFFSDQSKMVVVSQAAAAPLHCRSTVLPSRLPSLPCVGLF